MEMAVGIMLLYGCVDKLEGVTPGGNRKLVVYGYIHNGEPPYRVEVTRSQLYSGGVSFINSISEAIITLHEEGGSTEELKETAPGIYETCEERIQVTPGNEYWLTMNIPQTGESYASVPEKMPLPVNINDMTVRAGQKQILSKNGGLVRPIHFNILAA